MNDYDIADHRNLAARIIQLEQPWVVTYDYAAVGNGLYQSHRRIVYDLPYTTQARYKGREVMFLSERLKLPDEWDKSIEFPMRPVRSRYPVYGIIEHMKPPPNMDEGPQAQEQFLKVLKAVLAVPKSAVANPFKKQQERPATPKG